jgi:hypothetical protein
MKPVVAGSLKNSFGQMAVYALSANAHIHPEELYPQSPILQDSGISLNHAQMHHHPSLKLCKTATRNP